MGSAPHCITDETHAAKLRSWVASAEDLDADFPIQNLPYGRFRRLNSEEPWRIGVAIGDQVLDLAGAASEGRWEADIATMLAPLAAGDLAALMSRPSSDRRRLRTALSRALRVDGGQPQRLAASLVPQAGVELSLPCRIGDYTDFYTGIHHATAVGKLFRPDNPLLPNYKWVPIGYHGRSSSIVVSGTSVRRPRGQLQAGADAPTFGPSQRLDYELELGFLVGPGNGLGEPIAIDRAEEHLFGVVLLNDWSARDLQAWEYQPLGPFLSKNFATTISPWVVTMEALAPFRARLERPSGDPRALPYLDDERDRESGALDIELQVWLQTATHRQAGQPGACVSSANAQQAAYWTPAQLIAHHTSGGCNLQPGDLLGSGTLSGRLPGQSGSLLELTRGGREAIDLGDGQTRTFLTDGDAVKLTARCSRPGARSIGFGSCVGHVAEAWP
jgi:fumarylacetoacetase